ATVISYATYALIMELVVRKTAGKAILKILVIGDRGVRASTGQVFIRNLMRLIELAPPFWILGFLVVLTPRRQRVGDVFAQTAVVQVVPTSRDSNAANEPIDSESKDES
ncbi:MAG: RDD family protein, partial [Phycisphaerae bacterium]